jgi:hypothetical protein
MNYMPMSIRGGLDMYSFGDRYLDDQSPEGRAVYFSNRNGYEMDREHAARLFKENEVLTVKEIYVGRSNSEVEFAEYPNQRFNTVMFEDITE